MTLTQSVIGLFASYPFLAPALSGALIVLVLVAIRTHRRTKKEKREENRKREEEISLAVETVRYARYIMDNKITMATLLDDLAAASAIRTEQGDRNTIRRARDTCVTQGECGIALDRLEQARKLLEAGIISCSEIGVTELKFKELIDYFRESFPVI